MFNVTGELVNLTAKPVRLHVFKRMSQDVTLVDGMMSTVKLKTISSVKSTKVTYIITHQFSFSPPVNIHNLITKMP